MKQQNFADQFFEQAANISKAHNYDILRNQVQELKVEIAILKSEKAQLEIMLKGSQDMVQALKDFVNDVRPKGAPVIELGTIDHEIEDELNRGNDPDDLKDVL